MNTNVIRFYLHNYDSLQTEIKNLQEALDIYKNMIDVDGLRATIITDMPKNNKNTSITEKEAVKRLEYIKDLQDEITSKMKILRAINSVILYLSPEHKEIIKLRYLYTPIGRPKMSWKEISEKMYCEEQSCRQTDCRIIRQIQYNLHENVYTVSTDMRKMA